MIFMKNVIVHLVTKSSNGTVYHVHIITRIENDRNLRRFIYSLSRKETGLFPSVLLVLDNRTFCYFGFSYIVVRGNELAAAKAKLKYLFS